MLRFKHLYLYTLFILMTLCVWACESDNNSDSTNDEPSINDGSFTTQVINLKVFIGPDETACNIIANLHRPLGVTADNPAPALMATNGFGGSKDDGYTTGTNNELMQFAKHGYVGLSYSGLGFGGSDCLISMDDKAYDGLAASQLAQFLGGTPGIAYEKYVHIGDKQIWSRPIDAVDYVKRDDARSGIGHDPRVGMIGASYGGAVLYAAAAVDPRIDTIVPQETWTNLMYSLTPNNADLDDDLMSPALGVAKKLWAEAFFMAGLMQPTLHPLVYRPETDCPGFRPEACPVLTHGFEYGYPDETALLLNPDVSPLLYADQIDIPVFINQGINDSLFNLNESIAIYNRLKQRGVPVKLLWMSWGHGGGNCLNPFPPGPPCAGLPAPGELDATEPLEESYQGQLYLDWFDHWLKDKPVSTGAEFSYYRDWVPGPAYGPNGDQYAKADRYPVSTETRLYLSGVAELVDTPREIKWGRAALTTSARAATSYSELSAIDRNQPTYDVRGTYMAFTSQPLASDTVVVGTPILDVQLQAPKFLESQADGPSGKLILFAKIYDVAPDGTQVLPNRLVAPVRIPDVAQRVRISFPTLVYRFAAGHRLQMVLAQGDLSYASNTIAGKVKIVNSASRPNILILPVVDEQ